MKHIRPHHKIEIEQCTNGGWIVTIGCARFPETDLGTMMKNLRKYLKNPEKEEKEYYVSKSSDTLPEIKANWRVVIDD